MRCNLVSLVLTIAWLGSGAPAQLASLAPAQAHVQAALPRVAPTPILGAITEVTFLGEAGGAAHYQVAGLLAPNTTGMLAVQFVGDGIAGFAFETQVRSNGAGEFVGVVSVPDYGRLVAVVLFGTSGNVLATWHAASAE